MDRRTQRRGWLRFLSLITLSALAFCTIHLSPFLSDDCTAIEFTPVQTPSQGYQPQFQVSGSKIYHVWHEYDGPFRQIFTAEMNVDGTGWRAEKLAEYATKSIHRRPSFCDGVFLAEITLSQK
jgi:hypothetical protein